MSGCSLDDAFPGGAFGSASCLDTGAAEQSRRQEKKEARQCRGPHYKHLKKGWNAVGNPDPDRPAVKKMNPVPKLNQKTGLTEHQPVEQQYPWEGFVGEMEDLQTIRNKAKEQTNSLPMGDVPAFFGADPNDSRRTAKGRGMGTEHFTNLEAPINVIGTDETYRLVPDFAKTFSVTGVEKATGNPETVGPSPISTEMSYLTKTNMQESAQLPYPNLDNYWKSGPITGGQSAFFNSLRAPGGLPSPAPEMKEDETKETKREVLEKLDRIFARMDQLEQTKTENAQTEVLLFIMTGLGVIFLMDLSCRASANLLRR